MRLKDLTVVEVWVVILKDCLVIWAIWRITIINRLVPSNNWPLILITIKIFLIINLLIIILHVFILSIHHILPCLLLLRCCVVPNLVLIISILLVLIFIKIINIILHSHSFLSFLSFIVLLKLSFFHEVFDLGVKVRTIV